MPRPRLRAALGAASLVLLTSACSMGSDAFDENFPNDQPGTEQRLVVRTPEVVQPDLPFETPPLIVPLPGPTGGVPGDTPTTSAPFSPGPGSEGDTAEQDQK